MRTSWPPHHVDGKDVKMATFAGGCFWGLELAYQRKPGVLRTCVGYTQGHVERPTYRQVCSGRTGHTEAVQLTYDTRQVTYPELVDLFFDRIDPTALNRQGNDVGTQYRTGIYYHDEEQKREAEQAKSKIPGAVTEVLPAAIFWPAEDYHQQYLEKGGQSAEKTCKDPIRCYG
eukprot:jgi/Pico_ML_1/55413/g1101.t2